MIPGKGDASLEGLRANQLQLARAPGEVEQRPWCEHERAGPCRQHLRLARYSAATFDDSASVSTVDAASNVTPCANNVNPEVEEARRRRGRSVSIHEVFSVLKLARLTEEVTWKSLGFDWTTLSLPPRGVECQAGRSACQAGRNAQCSSRD